MKNILITVLMMISSFVFGQNLEGNYSGFWASTEWNYIFEKDGNFEFITEGHLGFTNTKGKYKIVADTLFLKARKTEKGTLNIDTKMLIDKDSCIIDLDLRYDYCKTKNREGRRSHIRNIKFPQTESENLELIADLRKVIILSLSNTMVSEYFHFKDLPNRKLILKPYFQLKELNFPNLKIDNKEMVFCNDRFPEFLIEFSDINQNKNEIQIEFDIIDEGVHFSMTYIKANNDWVLDYEYHYEN